MKTEDIMKTKRVRDWTIMKTENNMLRYTGIANKWRLRERNEQMRIKRERKSMTKTDWRIRLSADWGIHQIKTKLSKLNNTWIDQIRMILTKETEMNEEITDRRMTERIRMKIWGKLRNTEQIRLRDLEWHEIMSKLDWDWKLKIYYWAKIS